MKEASENQGHVYRARVGAADAGCTVLDFHVARYRHSDEAAWRESIAMGRVLVNGRRATADERLEAGDRLEFHRPPWEEPDAPVSFDVAFEDDDVLVVVKPAGLQVLPAGPFKQRTLLEIVRTSDPARAAAAPAHRLGRGTSGLIAFGKTLAGRASLARQFRDLTMTKTYLAWVEGARLPDSFAARQPIGRIAHGPLQIYAAAERGKESLTRVRVLRRGSATPGGATPGAGTAGAGDPGSLDASAGPSAASERALVAAQPITGRPDQIRIHLAAAGAPIVGDPLFGPGGTPKSHVPPGTGGYLLHAVSLSFALPSGDMRVKVRSLPDWA
ncbi:MAG TPA: RluA family pseudouridine synthase [Gammaproteobacteria bacterium]|nr:RluA family pseudouridine synthase [Gammaproteobacteria bacterium]